jgi:hypothetical protein
MTMHEDMDEDRRFDPATDDDLLADTVHTNTDRTDTGRTDVHRTDTDRTDVHRTDIDRADAGSMDLGPEPLVAQDAAVDLRARWDVIQQGFVDDPRNAVSEADHLVDDVLTRLSETFVRQHQDLEKQWSDGEPSTEDLRTALQRYRAFFQRLLTI